MSPFLGHMPRNDHLQYSAMVCMRSGLFLRGQDQADIDALRQAFMIMTNQSQRARAAIRLESARVRLYAVFLWRQPVSFTSQSVSCAIIC